MDYEISRILNAFKLNPYEKLNLHFDCSLSDVRIKFRKLSLIVHPDKTRHSKANEAFETIRNSQEEILDDKYRAILHKILELALRDVLKEQNKDSLADININARVLSLFHDNNINAIEAKWRESEEFYNKWILKSREFLARVKFRNQTLAKKIVLEEKHSKDKCQNVRIKIAKKNRISEVLKMTREKRIKNWRFFQKQQNSIVGSQLIKKKIQIHSIRPPLLNLADQNKTYVQRKI